MNKAKKLIKNTAMLFTGSFVTKILSFLLVPFYTSILSTSDYGTADLISTTVLLVLPFTSLLMDEAVMRFALDRGNDQKQVFTIAMTVSTAGFIVAMCLSPIILLFESIRPYYWFVILYYVSLWIYNICTSYVKGLDKFSVIAIAGVVHTIFYIGINILCLAILKIGVYGYLLAIDLSNLIAALLLIISCKLYKNFVSIKKIDRDLAKKMINYSVPMIPDYISWWVVNCSDRYMVAFFCGTGVTGIYSVAYKIPSVLSSLTSIFSSAWRISSVDEFGSEASIRFYKQVYRTYSCILFVGGAILIACVKILAKILFANEFYAAWRITPILIFAYILSAQAIFVGSIFTASKKTKNMAVAPLIGAIVNIVMNAILIPIYGGTGAAIGTVIGYIAILLINLYMTSKILNMHLLIKQDILVYMIIVIEIIAFLSETLIGWSVVGICCVVILLLNLKWIRSVFEIFITRFNKKQEID